MKPVKYPTKTWDFFNFRQIFRRRTESATILLLLSKPGNYFVVDVEETADCILVEYKNGKRGWGRGVHWAAEGTTGGDAAAPRPHHLPPSGAIDLVETVKESLLGLSTTLYVWMHREEAVI